MLKCCASLGWETTPLPSCRLKALWAGVATLTPDKGTCVCVCGRVGGVGRWGGAASFMAKRSNETAHSEMVLRDVKMSAVFGVDLSPGPA